MTALRIVAVCMLVVAGGGCEKRSAFCNDNPEAPGCGGGSGTDSGPGSCSPACADPTPVCDETNTCVACVTDGDCHVATEPVCSDVGGGGKTCHGCDSSTDCPDSNACLPSGACADKATTLYVSVPGGNDVANTTCDFDHPCATITHAIVVHPVNPTVVLTGASSELLDLRNVNLTLLGGAGASILAITTHNVTLTVAGVAVSNVGTTVGIHETEGGTVTLDRVEITQCNGGYQNDAGDVTITRSSIHDNQAFGVLLQAASGAYTITNTVVANNVGTAQIGGVTLDGASGTFAFNTVVGNENGSTATKAGGIQCNVGSVVNSIVVGNIHHGGTMSNLGGGCTGNTGNVLDVAESALMFKGATDFELTSGSTMALDQVAPMTDVPTDNKGTVRPQGSNADVGAFELKAQ